MSFGEHPDGDTYEKLDATMKDAVEETPEELQSMRTDRKQEQQNRRAMRLLAASSSQPQPETTLKNRPYMLNPADGCQGLNGSRTFLLR